MRRLLLPLMLLCTACTVDDGGDTDFWWADGTDGFQYDDCYDVPFVGNWAATSDPAISVLTFSTDCSWDAAGLTSGTSTTGALPCYNGLFDYVTDNPGTVTLRNSGTVCATCSYTVTGTNMTMDCGIAGAPISFVKNSGTF